MRISDWSSDVCSSDLPVAPRAEHDRDAVEEADLVLDIDAELLLRLFVEGARRIIGQQRVIVDVVEVDGLQSAIIALADLVPAIVEADEQLVLDIGAGVEVELDRKSTRMNSSH